MRRSALILAALVCAAPLPGQGIDNYGLELRSFVGAFVPTAKQSNDFKTATTVGAQLAWEMSENFHLLGSYAWTHGHNKFAFSDDRTYISQYDVGVEMNHFRELSESWVFRPFVGLGAGARTYDYRATGIGSRTCAAGYGAVGMEMQWVIIAFRAEARDYLTCFESPMTGRKQTRSDLGLTFGLAYHIR